MIGTSSANIAQARLCTSRPSQWTRVPFLVIGVEFMIVGLSNWNTIKLDESSRGDLTEKGRLQIHPRTEYYKWH
jgi:hypothetical protein